MKLGLSTSELCEMQAPVLVMMLQSLDTGGTKKDAGVRDATQADIRAFLG